jgi:hypothetical protein
MWGAPDVTVIKELIVGSIRAPRASTTMGRSDAFCSGQPVVRRTDPEIVGSFALGS